jgi:hypothetical protein
MGTGLIIGPPLADIDLGTASPIACGAVAAFTRTFTSALSSMAMGVPARVITRVPTGVITRVLTRVITRVLTPMFTRGTIWRTIGNADPPHIRGQAGLAV